MMMDIEEEEEEEENPFECIKICDLDQIPDLIVNYDRGKQVKVKENDFIALKIKP